MNKQFVIGSSSDVNHGAAVMPKYEILYSDRATIPDILDRQAQELGLTPVQLIKRFIAKGIQQGLEAEGVVGPCVLGESIEDFQVKNDVLKPK